MSALWEQLLKEEYEQGREAGIEKGIEQERLSSIRAVMTTCKLTAEKAMDMLAIPKINQERYKAML